MLGSWQLAASQGSQSSRIVGGMCGVLIQQREQAVALLGCCSALVAGAIIHVIHVT